MPPPKHLSARPKLTPEERRTRQADRLTTICLRMAIGRKLEDRGITTPAAIGQALGMPATEAAVMAAQAPLVPEPAVTLPNQIEGEAVWSRTTRRPA
jgi:hypothetical protein